MSMKPIKLELSSKKYAVMRFEKDEALPEWVYKADWFSITKTDDELSVVCSEEVVEFEGMIEKDFRMFKVVGPLDFSMVGIIAQLSNICQLASVSIFVLSTYDTDYLMIREKDTNVAIKAFENNHIYVKIIEEI